MVENTKSELKLFAGQAVNALKSEVATMVTDKLVTTSVKDFAQDKDYLNAFIVALASKWSVDEPIVISTADAESLKKYFAAHAKDKGSDYTASKRYQRLCSPFLCGQFL